MLEEFADKPDPPLIAIVDDDEDVRQSLDTLVRSHGYDTALLASADAFLASPALTSVLCVVTDVQMPGTSGLQLARVVRDGVGQPVILITAFPAPDLEEKAHLAGVTSVFRKPFDPDALMDEIARTLD